MPELRSLGGRADAYLLHGAGRGGAHGVLQRCRRAPRLHPVGRVETDRGRRAGGRDAAVRATGARRAADRRGRALLRHAARVLDDVAAARQELTGFRDRVAGRLVVGGYPTAMASLIPRALARLLDAHPAIEVRLSESPTPRQLAALRRGRLEVAVVATGEGLPEYDLDGPAADPAARRSWHRPRRRRVPSFRRPHRDRPRRADRPALDRRRRRRRVRSSEPGPASRTRRSPSPYPAG